MAQVSRFLGADAPLRNNAILEITVLNGDAFFSAGGDKASSPFAAIEATFEPHPAFGSGVLHRLTGLSKRSPYAGCSVEFKLMPQGPGILNALF